MQGGEREQEPLPRARDGTRTARRAEKESAENLAEARVEAAQQVEEARKEGFMEGQAAGLERVRSHLESLVKKAGELQDNEEVSFNSSPLLKWLAKELTRSRTKAWRLASNTIKRWAKCTRKRRWPGAGVALPTAGAAGVVSGIGLLLLGLQACATLATRIALPAPAARLMHGAPDAGT